MELKKKVFSLEELCTTKNATEIEVNFSDDAGYIEIPTKCGQTFDFLFELFPDVPKNYAEVSLFPKRWASIYLNNAMDLKFYRLSSSTKSEANFPEMDFLHYEIDMEEPHNSILMSENQPIYRFKLSLVAGQPTVFSFQNERILAMVVKEPVDLTEKSEEKSVNGNALLNLDELNKEMRVKINGLINLIEKSKEKPVKSNGLVSSTENPEKTRVGANSLLSLTEKSEENHVQANGPVSLTQKSEGPELRNHIKLALSPAARALEIYLSGGWINWGTPVSSLLEEGAQYIKLARAPPPENSGLISILLEGSPKSGKTALAAKLAVTSDFPIIKVCSPEDMVGWLESAKCRQILKIFDDAYLSPLSCIVIDDIERLLFYGPFGPRYSNSTLQHLLVLLKKKPPNGRKLLILCTTSKKQVLEDMDMLPAFTSILHVPNLSKPEDVIEVLKKFDLFSTEELTTLAKGMSGYKVFVGIKKLLELISVIRQTEQQNRVIKFLSKFREEGC